ILSRSLNGRADGSASGSTLRSPWWVDPRQDQRRGVRRHLDWLLLPSQLVCPNCRRPTDCRLCPCCHRPVPDAALTGDAGHITIFGPQSVGKTTYMTVLLHELDQRVGPERGLLLEPLTEEIRERYRLEYHDITYGSSQFGVGEEMAVDSS